MNLVADQAPEPEDVLAEQVAYYRARAGEYDRWFYRQGRYDRGEAVRAAWFSELDEVRGALAELPIDGAEVLELAAGTGIWTQVLAERAAQVTAVDASPEMVAENRKRLGSQVGRVSFVLADLFAWASDRQWDAVVFCFWISHVPEVRLDRFLAGVSALVRPGGWVFFLDGRPEPTSTAADHVLPLPDQEVMIRRLDDGREYHIVKNFWPAAELEMRCRRAGLDVQVAETGLYFQYGRGRRVTSSPAPTTP
jgi:demethylmenaquinone methyltransferase/2-methoxy-6-polyprenyl-1,4-benzoquinol methylase